MQGGSRHSKALEEGEERKDFPRGLESLTEWDARTIKVKEVEKWFEDRNGQRLK